MPPWPWLVGFCCISHAWLLPSSIIRQQYRLGADTNDSLSYMVSSPERYARALNQTLEEVQTKLSQRQAAVDELNRELSCTSLTSQERSQLVTHHRFVHGKHPYVCRECWSYQPVCVCPEAPTKIPIPCRAVVIWTHKDEWGSPTNTGSTLPLVLENCHLWMNDYHNQQLHQLTNKSGVQPVVLWPEPSGKASSFKSKYWTDPEIVQNVVLVVPEGTWRQARRLVSKFPKEWPRVSLDQTMLQQVLSTETSLIAPLRCRHKAPINSVCTAEATVAILEHMGMYRRGEEAIQLARTKVDRTRRYLGRK